MEIVRKAVCSPDDIPGLIHGIRRAVYDQQELIGLESDVVFHDAIFGDSDTDTFPLSNGDSYPMRPATKNTGREYGIAAVAPA